MAYYIAQYANFDAEMAKIIYIFCGVEFIE